MLNKKLIQTQTVHNKKFQKPTLFQPITYQINQSHFIHKTHLWPIFGENSHFELTKDFIVSDSDIVLLTKFKENKKDPSKSIYQVIDTLRWSIEEGQKFTKKLKIAAKDIDGPCGRPVSLAPGNGKMAVLTLEQEMG